MLGEARARVSQTPVRPRDTSVARLRWIAVMRRSNEGRGGFLKKLPVLLCGVIGASRLGSIELTRCKRVNYSPAPATGCSHRVGCSRRRLLGPPGATLPRREGEKKERKKKQQQLNNHRHPLAGINSLSSFCVSKLFNLCCCQ